MEKHIHRWPRREEQYLVKLTKDPEIAAVFKEDFVKGCAMIAEEINKHWSRPDNYVPLDAIKVESKLKGCKQVFAKTDKEGPSQSASQGALYSNFGEAITSALSLRPKKVAKKQVSASSGANKVAKKKKKKFINTSSALEYMKENGSSYIDLCVYANALRKPGILDVFNITKTFEEKVEMFNQIVAGEEAIGKWTGSKGKLAPPIHDLTESSSEEE